jgi:hypothetical protein
MNECVYIHYTNWRGVTALRKIRPTGKVVFTSNQYHPEPQWLLEAIDVENGNATKLFAMQTIHSWTPEPPA